METSKDQISPKYLTFILGDGSFRSIQELDDEYGDILDLLQRNSYIEREKLRECLDMLKKSYNCYVNGLEA